MMLDSLVATAQQDAITIGYIYGSAQSGDVSVIVMKAQGKGWAPFHWRANFTLSGKVISRARLVNHLEVI